MGSNASSKRPRAPNFTQSERGVFVELIEKYKNTVENKKTDAQTRTDKANGWKRLAVEFNSLSSVHHRSEDNLKSLWDNLKKTARKASSHERQETFKTGGGPRDTSGDPSKVDQSVLALLGPSGVGLNNMFDGDTSMQCESIEETSELWEEVEVENQTVPLADQGSIVIVGLSGVASPSAVITEPAQVPTTVEGELSSSIAGLRWDETIPSHLNSSKSAPLRVSGEACSLQCDSTPGSKRKKTDKSAWSRRRRPSLPADQAEAKELIAAKLELAHLTKIQLQEEEKRRQALFKIEKQKKALKVELLQLQVLKTKQELNLE